MADLIPARTRVAPSPTGDPHVGTAFMALFDLAWARKTGGKFVLRIEDTDQARLVEGSEQQIYDSLEWLGLQPDEGPHVGGEFGPYRQSERLETYRPYVDQLIADGHAYHCWCSSERLKEMRDEQAASKQANTGYDRFCVGMTREERAKQPGFTETPVVRMLVPDDAPTTFDDIIRGEVKAPFPDDQVILKADGFPTYHMAVVVDDHLMGITTVVRGEEWISSTPKHVLLYQWLGWEVPQFAHMPLLRNTDKSKISKRKNPAARLLWFKEQGYLPEAVRNFLQLLGYAGDDEEDVKSFEQFVEEFAWAKVNPVGPIFDLEKLDWLNGHYIRTLSVDELTDRIVEYASGTGQWEQTMDVEILRQAVPIIQERLTLLKDALPQLDFLFAEGVEIADDARASLADNAAEVLDAGIEVVESVEFDAES
ncbi:MAG: glutamate--tRNA ligase, partial [Propionibacterium sp.]|nr:glutamate--tRNA ligase [Propionibacterium sp.]